jgi:hypothetical protein
MEGHGPAIWHFLVWYFLFSPFGIGVGLLTGWVAKQKRRSFFGWFIIGTLLPLIGMLALIAVPAKEPREQAVMGRGPRR